MSYALMVFGGMTIFLLATIGAGTVLALWMVRGKTAKNDLGAVSATEGDARPRSVPTPMLAHVAPDRITQIAPGVYLIDNAYAGFTKTRIH